MDSLEEKIANASTAKTLEGLIQRMEGYQQERDNARARVENLEIVLQTTKTELDALLNAEREKTSSQNAEITNLEEALSSTKARVRNLETELQTTKTELDAATTLASSQNSRADQLEIEQAVSEEEQAAAAASSLTEKQTKAITRLFELFDEEGKKKNEQTLIKWTVGQCFDMCEITTLMKTILDLDSDRLTASEMHAKFSTFIQYHKPTFQTKHK